MTKDKLYLHEEFARDVHINVGLERINPIDGYSDYSEFIEVDCEEGDYGIIKYYDENKELIAVNYIYGGDDSEWKWSKKFKERMMLELMPIIVKASIGKIANWSDELNED